MQTTMLRSCEARPPGAFKTSDADWYMDTGTSRLNMSQAQIAGRGTDTPNVGVSHDACTCQRMAPTCNSTGGFRRCRHSHLSYLL